MTDNHIDETLKLDDVRMLLIESRNIIQVLQRAAEDSLNMIDESGDRDDPDVSDFYETVNEALGQTKPLIEKLISANSTIFASGGTPRTTTPIMKLRDHAEAWTMVKRLNNLMTGE